MAVHLRGSLRGLFGRPNAVAVRCHTSVMLWPTIRVKDPTTRRPKASPKPVEELLDAAEERLRGSLERLQKELAQAPLTATRQGLELGEQLRSDDSKEQLRAARQCRRMLSVEHDAPIQDFVAAGLVEPLVKLLERATLPELQFEVAWALTNITSGTAEQTRVVIEHGALPIFLRLVEGVDENVCQQAMWAIGNIAGDSPDMRNAVLEAGGLGLIASVLSKSDNLLVLRNGAWLLSNFCRGRPPPALEFSRVAAEALEQLLAHPTAESDEDVLVDACWAAAYLADGSSVCRDALMQAKLCPHLIRLLCHSTPRVQGAALRAVCNIAAGNDEQTQALLESGVLPALEEALSSSCESNRKDACWAISNITAGSRAQIQEVLNSGVIQKMMVLLQTEGLPFKTEAAWAIGNAVTGGSVEHVQYLVRNGCIKPLVDLLGTKDVEVCTGSLGVIEKILRVGQELQEQQGLVKNPFADSVQHAGGRQKIEALQAKSSEHIYQQVTAILAHFSSSTAAP